MIQENVMFDPQLEQLIAEQDALFQAGVEGRRWVPDIDQEYTVEMCDVELREIPIHGKLTAVITVKGRILPETCVDMPEYGNKKCDIGFFDGGAGSWRASKPLRLLNGGMPFTAEPGQWMKDAYALLKNYEGIHLIIGVETSRADDRYKNIEWKALLPPSPPETEVAGPT